MKKPLLIIAVLVVFETIATLAVGFTLLFWGKTDDEFLFFWLPLIGMNSIGLSAMAVAFYSLFSSILKKDSSENENSIGCR